MNTISREQVKKLTELGVGFYCNAPIFGGQDTFDLSIDDLLIYIKDHTAFLASKYNVTKN